MKVLIVDDSKVTRMFIENALASSDITDVDQAADGQEAIDAVLEYAECFGNRGGPRDSGTGENDADHDGYNGE